MTRILRLIRGSLADNFDLLLLWIVSVVLWPIIPSGTLLARDDLTPWLIAILCVGLLLRGRELGAGPHPMLTARRSVVGAACRRLASALAPATLLAGYEAAARGSADATVAAVVGVIVISVLLGLGRSHGQTAWQPRRRIPWRRWLLLGVLSLISAALLGWLSTVLIPFLQEASACGLLGVSFLSAGLISGRVQHTDQRRAAGRRDGKPYRTDLFPFLMALGGPSLGMFLLFLLFEPLGGLDFSQGFVGGLHVVVWIALVWQRPVPIARTVLLHTVVPVSGRDPRAVGVANPFDAPPQGALRFTPLRTRATRVIHPWIVPVRGARIADLDDPVRPLWYRPPPPLPEHVLGEAAFEPDSLTRAVQGDVITIHLRGGEDTRGLSGVGGQSRRIVIIRPFLPPDAPRRQRLPTYAWDPALPRGAVQIIDNTVEQATLRDGDVLVVSVEGVARAFEVEIGAPIYDHAEVMFRPPQIEDYVTAGAS